MGAALALQCESTTDRLHDRLRNWGRAILYGYIQGQTGSYEGNYRSPQHWEDAPPPPPPPVDIQDAWKIEHAVGVTRLRSLVILRARYAYGWSDAKMQREFAHGELAAWGLRSWNDLQAAIAGAMVDVEEALAQPAVVRKQRARDIARRMLGPLDVSIVVD